MLYANLLLNVLYHIEIEMKIRESCLQTGNFIYKPGISLTKQDFHLQRESLGLQRGFSGYYLPDKVPPLDYLYLLYDVCTKKTIYRTKNIDLITCVYFVYKIKINGNYIHMNINRREHEDAGAY